MIMCSFDLLFLNMDYKKLIALNNNEPNALIIIVIAIMAIYYVIAIIVTYRAYNHYKILFMNQLGDAYEVHPQEHQMDQEA